MGVNVFLGTNKGLVIARSDDTRQNWDIEPLQFKGWSITAATRDNQGRYYLGTSSYVYGAVIMVSDDLKEWRQLENNPKYDEGLTGSPDHNRIISAGEATAEGQNPPRVLDQIWTLHCEGDTIYAGVSEAGLFRSDDRGDSWQPITGLNDHPNRANWMPGAGGLCTHVVLTDPSTPGRMWVGISAVGVMRSEDGGATWAAKNDGVLAGDAYCVHGLARDPDDANIIYRQDHRGMYRTRDGGDNWESIENGLPIGTVWGGNKVVFGFPIVMDPHTKAIFAVPLEGDEFHIPHDGNLRVYRSTNGGDQWDMLSKGLPTEPTYTSVLRGAMAVDGLSPCGIYFGTTSGTAYASADGGDSWSTIPVSLPRILSVRAFTE